MDKRDAVGERSGNLWRHGGTPSTGGYVDLKTASVDFNRPQPGWLQSSIELHDGLDIAEFCDPMPQEAFDRLFRA